MSEAAYEPDVTSLPADKADEVLWRARINAAESDPARKDAELSWLSSSAFVAGKQWVQVDRLTRTLRDISEVDERYADVDLVVADIIMERRGAALGELEQDSDRPEFLAPGDADQDVEEESVQKQVNRALGHAWDYESDADAVIAQAYQYTVDYGVAAIRVKFDKYAGRQKKSSKGEPVSAPIDIKTGQPIVDAEKARGYVADTAAQGQTAKFTPVNDGRICLEAGSAFNLLTPPGIPHEKNFPWEVWKCAVPLQDVKDEFGAAAADLQADTDIGSILGTTGGQTTAGGAKPGNLTGHVWLYIGFQRPSRKHPQGRKAVLAGGQKRLLQTYESLDYETVTGEWWSGIVYLHWWRLSDRFQSRGLIESLKDPQRMTNRTATQVQEIIDRCMPFGIREEGTGPERTSGRPMEWEEVKKGTTVEPHWIQGPGPGPWMQQHREQLIADADRASTISSLKLGENPQNVNTYSQLATLNEQEAGKRSTIRSGVQRARSQVAELMLLNIVKYWPESKQILVAGGESDELQAHDFSKSVIPPMWIVRPAKNSAKPRGQGAQLQLVQDIWNAAIASTAFTTNPLAWVQWLKDSYEAGQPIELPTPPTDNQAEKAERENHALLTGEQPAVAYWDNIAVHLPIHRQAEDQAILAGDIAALGRIEHHVQEHKNVAAENAQQLAAQQPAPLVPPGTPGSLPPAPSAPVGSPPTPGPAAPSLSAGPGAPASPVAPPPGQ